MITLVILISGLGDFFGFGLSGIASKLYDIPQVQVVQYSHLQKQAVLDRIRQCVDCRIAILSHSAGSNAALEIAEELYQENRPVTLLVTFDPAARFHLAPIRANVELAVGFYQTTSIFGRGRLTKSKMNHNTILVERKENISHVLMPSDVRLIKEVIADVKNLAKRK